MACARRGIRSDGARLPCVLRSCGGPLCLSATGAARECWLAATCGQLGNIEKARAEAAEALRIEPKYTIERTPARLSFKRTEDAEHFFDGLRKAGLPER